MRCLTPPVQPLVQPVHFARSQYRLRTNRELFTHTLAESIITIDKYARNDVCRSVELPEVAAVVVLVTVPVSNNYEHGEE